MIINHLFVSKIQVTLSESVPLGIIKNVGLGSSATRDVGTGLNEVVTVGSSGIGGNSRTGDNNVNSFVDRTCFFTAGNGGPTNGIVFGFNVVHGGQPVSYNTQLVFRNGRSYLRSLEANNYTPWYENYSQANTTKSSDGTLRAASPVARIVNSQADNQRKDVDEEGFTWCGCGTSNAEAEGINISRLDIGVYVLTGSAGLASEGWQLLPPMDPGGMGELGIVEAEQTESGGLTIRLFRRKFMLTETGEMVKTKGEPIDIPTNSWIDVRLDMPSDSAFNRRAAPDLVEQQS